jgi:hypothetical protein
MEGLMTSPAPEEDGYATFQRMHELGDQLLALDVAGHRRALLSLLGGLTQAAVHNPYFNSVAQRAFLLSQLERALEFAHEFESRPTPASEGRQQ